MTKNFRKAAGLVAGIMLLSACAGGNAGNEAGGDNNHGSSGNKNCTKVVVATSSEKVNLMEELGEAFRNSPEHDALNHCATIVPVNVASGKGSEVLSTNPSSWPLNDNRDYWPTIWSPASTMWTDRVESLGGPVRSEDVVHWAWTPVVLAMPETMAKAIGWPNAEVSINDINDLIADPAGWGSKGHPLWGEFRISKTNPNSSTTGASILLMQAYAHAGKTSGLTVADVDAAEDFSRQFESAAIHYGSTTGAVLQNLFDSRATGGSTYVSAIALEETSMFNYNKGNPDSHTVQPGENLNPPAEKLVAIYPSGGSLVSDNPAVILSSPWVSPEQHEAAAAFLTFLNTRTAQEILPQFGFRPQDDSVDISAYLNESVGINPDKPTTILERPAPEVLTAALDQWQRIRKPSSVMLLMDISGSMNRPVPDTSSTRLDLAIESAQSALTNFRNTDEVGLWVFTTEIHQQQSDGTVLDDVAIIRDVKTLGSDLETMKDGIAELRYVQKSGTPLYDAVLLAYEHMLERAEAGRINAIVILSDGEDMDSRISLESLVQRLRADSVKESAQVAPVKIFAIAFSEESNIDVLRQIAKATGGQAFDAKDASKINEVLSNVMTNF